MVFPPPNNDNNSNNLPSSYRPEREFPDISLERQEAAKKQARKWFLILLTTGLVLGIFVAFGVVQIIQKLGLDNKPNYRIQIDVQPDKQSPAP